MRKITQTDLRAMAEKHQEDSAVSALLTALIEAEVIAKMGIGYVEARLGALRAAMQGQEGHSVSVDQSDWVAQAHKAASALERISSTYTTLACVLGSLGEDVRGY